jgi:subtilisin family serine protease
VTAYVVDTGINADHDDFEGRAKKGPVFAPQGTRDEDLVGHGTHVAGTVGSKTFGVSKSVDIVGIKVFNDPRPFGNQNVGALTTDILRALDWVHRDVQSTSPPKKAVVNMSLGGGISAMLDQATAALVRAGIVVVCAAGNETVSLHLLSTE